MDNLGKAAIYSIGLHSWIESDVVSDSDLDYTAIASALIFMVPYTSATILKICPVVCVYSFVCSSAHI